MAAAEPAREDIFLPGGTNMHGIRHRAGSQVVCKKRSSLRVQTRWDSVRSPHIFMGLLAVPDPGVRTWGERLGADLGRLLGQFQELFHQDEGESESVLILNREFLSDNAIRTLRTAYARACDHQRKTVTPMDLLISLLTAESPNVVAHCFESIGVTAAKLTELAVLAEQQAGTK